MIKRPSLRILLSISIVFYLTIGCAPADNAWETVRERGVLRVGLDPTFPPFENADSGELHGLDVDLARALGQELGVDVEFVYFGFDGLYDALATAQVDVLISALVIDIAKTKDFAYSEPYFNAGQFLFVLEERADPRNESDPWTIAVELGSEGHVQAIGWQQRFPELEILPLPTAADALWVVWDRQVDAALVDQISGRLYQREYPLLRMIEEPVTVEPYAIVTRIDDVSLLEKINEGLANLQNTGALDHIINERLSS